VSDSEQRLAEVRVQVAHIARGCRSGLSHNPAVYEQEIDRLLDAQAEQLRELREALRDCAIAANNGLTQHEARKRGAAEKLRYIFKRSSEALLARSEEA